MCLYLKNKHFEVTALDDTYELSNDCHWNIVPEVLVESYDLWIQQSYQLDEYLQKTVNEDGTACNVTDVGILK